MDSNNDAEEDNISEDDGDNEDKEDGEDEESEEDEEEESENDDESVISHIPDRTKYSNEIKTKLKLKNQTKSKSFKFPIGQIPTKSVIKNNKEPIKTKKKIKNEPKLRWRIGIKWIQTISMIVQIKFVKNKNYHKI